MRLASLSGQKFQDRKVETPATKEYYEHCQSNGNKDIKRMLQDYAAAYENAKEFTVR